MSTVSSTEGQGQGQGQNQPRIIPLRAGVPGVGPADGPAGKPRSTACPHCGAVGRSCDCAADNPAAQPWGAGRGVAISDVPDAADAPDASDASDVSTTIRIGAHAATDSPDDRLDDDSESDSAPAPRPDPTTLRCWGPASSDEAPTWLADLDRPLVGHPSRWCPEPREVRLARLWAAYEADREAVYLYLGQHWGDWHEPTLHRLAGAAAASWDRYEAAWAAKGGVA